MTYVPFYSEWKNWPNISTPITAAAMQHIEDGIAQGGSGGGSSSLGAPVVRGPFSFAFATPGLTAGVAFYTPTIDDLWLDWWIEVDTAFDGTTPFADVGTFLGTTQGTWAATDSPGSAFTLTTAGNELGGAGVFGMSGVNSPGQNAITAVGDGISNAEPFFPARFTAANPLKLVVSQDGLAGGAAVGGAAGAGRLYIVTATPTGLGNGPGMQTTFVDLSAADILTSGTVPIEAIPAQGANTILVVDTVKWWLQADGMTPYETNLHLWLALGDSATVLDTGGVAVGKTPQTFLSDTANAFSVDGMLAEQPVADLAGADVVNVPLTIYNPGGDPTAGTGTMRVGITYEVFTVA